MCMTIASLPCLRENVPGFIGHPMGMTKQDQGSFVLKK